MSNKLLYVQDKYYLFKKENKTQFKDLYNKYMLNQMIVNKVNSIIVNHNISNINNLIKFIKDNDNEFFELVNISDFKSVAIKVINNSKIDRFNQNVPLYINKKDILQKPLKSQQIILSNRFNNNFLDVYLPNNARFSSINIQENKKFKDCISLQLKYSYERRNLFNDHQGKVLSLFMNDNKIVIADNTQSSSYIVDYSSVFNLIKNINQGLNSENESLIYYSSNQLKKMYNKMHEIEETILNILSKEKPQDMLIYNLKQNKYINDEEMSIVKMIYDRLVNQIDINNVNYSIIRPNIDMLYFNCIFDNLNLSNGNIYRNQLKQHSNGNNYLYSISEEGTYIDPMLNFSYQMLKYKDKVLEFNKERIENSINEISIETLPDMF